MGGVVLLTFKRGRWIHSTNNMDVGFVVGHLLEQLGLEQRDRAAAAQVTESYISPLLTRKKAPPSPDRTNTL